MTGIADALRASATTATPFTRSLFVDGAWGPEQVAAFVNEQRNITIATTNAVAQPHAAVVIGGAVHDAIYFTGHAESVMVRNLRRNDRIVFSVAGGSHVLMGQGSAMAVGSSEEAAALIDELAGASGIGRFTPPNWSGTVYRIEARRVFAS